MTVAQSRPGILYSVRNDRLGGRLGAMLNAKRIADDHGIEFRFLWASHENVSPELQHPEALFSADFLTRHREVDRGFGELQNNALSVETLTANTTRDAFLASIAAGNDVRCVEALRVVSMPWENSRDMGARVADTLHTIGFVPEIMAAMDAIRARLGDVELTAYHLRRGDIIDPASRPSNVLWPSKYVPGVFYEAHMRRVLDENPNNRIVVFSDAPHELISFGKLSDRIIAAPSLMPDGLLDPIQRDFLELYTMSRCERIIGPGASAFSSVAAILGNGRIIDIRTDLTKEERSSALDELTIRMKRRPESFAGDADLGQNFPELIAHHEAKGTSKVSLRILEQQLKRGFSLSYIYDLLAEQYFNEGDAEAALGLIETLSQRPILTDLANSQAYAWAGLAALAGQRPDDAARLAHTSNWLQPNLPISRILISAMASNQLFWPDDCYPIAPALVQTNPLPFQPKFRQIAVSLSSGIAALTGNVSQTHRFDLIPFELDVRDWAELQGTKLPSSFWNVPDLRKKIGFFRSTYRGQLDDPAVFSMLGQLHCRADDAETGIPLIEAAAEADPGDPLVIIRLARLRMRQDRAAEATSLYQRAADLSGGQTCFLAEQGLHLMRQQDKTAATEIFTQLAARNHHMIEVLILTADILRRSKPTRELALNAARRAERLAPGALRTTQVLRKALEQLDRQSEADAIEARMKDWRRSPGRFSSRV